MAPPPAPSSTPASPSSSPANTPASAAPADTTAPNTSPANITAATATQTDIQKRIERARALAAAHKLQSAAHELETIRKSAADDVLRNVTSVMLMNIYLEEGNYSRAQSLLEEDFKAMRAGKDAALRTYFAIAGQAVQGARAHLARYRSFGINVTDADLPAEATSDLERLRSLLEHMVSQAKEIANERKAYDILGLLEDVVGIRLSVPRDSEDRTKWENEYASAREGLASSQTQIASLSGMPPLQRAANGRASSAASDGLKPTIPTSVLTTSDSVTSAPVAGAAAERVEDQPVNAGLLNSKALKRVVPSYPALAKSSGVEGVVRVHIGLDESGKVIGIFKSEGPLLLRQSAEQAARGWQFGPTMVDGKAIRQIGYIEFTYTR